MASEEYKKRADSILKIAKEKKKITKYSDFSKTKLAQETALREDEVNDYTSEIEEETD